MTTSSSVPLRGTPPVSMAPFWKGLLDSCLGIRVPTASHVPHASGRWGGYVKVPSGR